MKNTLYDDGDLVVECDGRTLWIHRRAETIARFGPRGIDVHAHSQRLACAAGAPDFDLFAELMDRYHDVDVRPCACGEKLKDIADFFGIDITTASDIVRYKSWRL